MASITMAVSNTSSADNTIAESIRLAFDSLTRAERQLANTIVENYPVSGLGSITQVAEKSGVSSPTIVREDMFDRTRFFRKFT